MKNFVLIVSFLTFVFPCFAMEDSRPLSSGNDELIEFTAGTVRIEEKEIFEIGVDYEKFLEGWEHHLSIGAAAEYEFADHAEFYIGALVSLYYFHTKLFYTTGAQTDFKGNTYWKNRIGLGYEFFVTSHLILVPTIAVDHMDGHFHRAFNLGVAYEF